MSERPTHDELDFFMDNPLLGIVYLDKQYRIVRCNIKFEEMFGYKLDEIERENLDEIVDGDQGMTMISQNGESIHGSGKRKKKDGTYIEVEIYGIPKILGGAISGTLGIYLDITDRKLAEEMSVKSQDELEERVKERTAELTRRNEQLHEEIVAHEQTQETLQESEEQYRSLVESTEDCIYLVDRDGTYLFVDEKHLSRLGCQADKVIGKTYGDFHPLEDTKEFVRKIEEVFETDQTIQYEHRSHRDNKYFLRTLSPVKSPEGHTRSVTVVSKEITERKQAEDVLRESEKKYRSTLNDLLVGVVVHASDTSILLSNPEATNILGLTYEQMSGKKAIDPAWNFVHEDSTVMKVEEYPVSRTFSTKKPIHDYVAGINRPDRDYVTWVNVNTTPVFSNHNELEKIVVNFVDITARKQAEEALRESEERYRTLMDNLPVAVNRNTPGPEGQFLMANPAFCKMFGFKNEEEVKDFTPASFYQNPKERKEYSDNLIEKGLIKNYERTLLKRDGTPVHTSITASVVHGKDGRISHFDSIMLDITEQKLSEQALKGTEEELRIKTKSLEEMNTALKILLSSKDQDQREFEEKILANVKHLVQPYLGKMRKHLTDEKLKAYLHILETNLNNIISPFSRKLSSKYMYLTTTEIEVANLVKEGRTSKDIAEMLGTSYKTIQNQRVNIRKKLGITKEPVNLRTYLSSLQ